MRKGFIMKAEELDEIFDKGEEDIIPYLDVSTIRHPNLNQRRVNVDLPIWMIEQLDQHAKMIGVTRQSMIKFWLSEKIEGKRQTQKDVLPLAGKYIPG